MLLAEFAEPVLAGFTGAGGLNYSTDIQVITIVSLSSYMPQKGGVCHFDDILKLKFF